MDYNFGTFSKSRSEEKVNGKKLKIGSLLRLMVKSTDLTELIQV